MRKTIVLLFLLTSCCAMGQQRANDSLKKELYKTGEDTNRVLLLDALAINYYLNRPDTAILFAQQAYDLSLKLHYPKGAALSLNRIAAAYSTLGDYAKSLVLFNKALRISQQIDDVLGIFRGYNNIGDNYATRKDYKKALEYFKKAQALSGPEVGSYGQVVLSLNIGDCYLWLQQYDSASVCTSLKLMQRLKKKVSKMPTAILIATSAL